MSDAEKRAEARRWHRFAEEDLLSAKGVLSSTGIARHACWLAQQAAEKAIKALLISLEIEFPRSHDLDLLLNLLPAAPKNRFQSLDLSKLTEWAVEARYPGDWPEASTNDADLAIETAESVVRVAVNELAD